MRWGENWRLYLTPGDGLLISLLEEFLSKSVSFINDISLCSVRHLLSSQKGNYLFRPGNNISYCLSSRARREAKPRSREKQSQGFLSPDWRMPGSLIHLADSLSYAKRACVCECLHFSVCMSVCVCACVCVCDWDEGTWGDILPPLPEIPNTDSFTPWASKHLLCARPLPGHWGAPGMKKDTLPSRPPPWSPLCFETLFSSDASSIAVWGEQGIS